MQKFNAQILFMVLHIFMAQNNSAGNSLDQIKILD